MNEIKRPYSSSGKIYYMTQKYLNFIEPNNDIDSILKKYLNFNQNYNNKYNYNKIFNFNNSNYSSNVLNKKDIIINNSLDKYENYNISPIKITSNNYTNIYDNTNYSIQSNLSSLINKKNNSYYPSPNFSNYNIINQIYSFQNKNNNFNIISNTSNILTSNTSNLNYVINNNRYYNNSEIVNNKNQILNISFSKGKIIKPQLINNNNTINQKSNYINNIINNNKLISGEITLNDSNYSIKLEELINNKKSFFVLILASKNNKGKSWCKDCIIAEPYIKNIKKIVIDNNFLWINIPIDKEKKYLYQYNHYLQLSLLPTLIYFKNGKEICRLVQQSLFNQKNIKTFMLKCLKNYF